LVAVRAYRHRHEFLRADPDDDPDNEAETADTTVPEPSRTQPSSVGLISALCES
jgi:hypothetical protein